MDHGYIRQLFIGELVGGVDGPPTCEDVVPNTSSSNIENLQEHEVLQFVTIEKQIVFWNPHHQNSTY